MNSVEREGRSAASDFLNRYEVRTSIRCVPLPYVDFPKRSLRSQDAISFLFFSLMSIKPALFYPSFRSPYSIRVSIQFRYFQTSPILYFPKAQTPDIQTLFFSSFRVAFICRFLVIPISLFQFSSMPPFNLKPPIPSSELHIISHTASSRSMNSAPSRQRDRNISIFDFVFPLRERPV